MVIVKVAVHNHNQLLGFARAFLQVCLIKLCRMQNQRQTL